MTLGITWSASAAILPPLHYRLRRTRRRIGLVLRFRFSPPAKVFTAAAMPTPPSMLDTMGTTSGKNDPAFFFLAFRLAIFVGN